MALAYVALSVVAHTDWGGRPGPPPLSPLERQGLDLWRRHNCQVCHQLHGFGGFLGPDLTNRVDEETPTDELSWILERGSGRMPAFRFGRADQEALLAYLRAMNRTGRSQPRPPVARRPEGGPEHLARLVAAWDQVGTGSWPDDARRGAALWTELRCGGCHALFAPGRFRAPDLSRATADTEGPAFRKLLERGRRQMPSYRLEPGEAAALEALLALLRSRRSELVAANDRLLARDPFSWTDVAWWEYR